MTLRTLVLLFALTASAFGAELLKVGEPLPAFVAKDQHEAEVRYTPGELRLLVVSYEMSAGKAANAWLAKQPGDFLKNNRALFLADIHGMPGVGRMFAMPKMRKYPHRIVLGDDDKLLERHPRQKGCLTVFVFDAQGVVTDIRFVDPEKEPQKAFQP